MKLASVEAIVRALIRMKEAVGREQDRIDVEHLRLVLEEGSDGQ